MSDGRTGPQRRTPAWLLASLAIPLVLQLFAVNFWPAFASPNERTRAYQAMAVADRGALDIGPELARFGAMEDVAEAGGRRYPNKAPGLLPLLAPAALVAHWASRGDPAAELRLTLVLGRLLAASLPFLLTVLLLGRAAAEVSPRGAAVIAAVYALASPALPASLLLFAHAATPLLLLVAYLTLLAPARPRPGEALIGGLALAWTVCCEYQLAVPAAVLAVAAVPRLRLRGVVLAVAGAAGPLGLLGAYNLACFGSPFSISSMHEAAPQYAALAAHGLFGITLPTPLGLARVLLAPDRGLLVWLPLVAAAALAWRRTTASTRPPGLGAIAGAAAALVLVMAGYVNWHGGWFPGPRYLLAVVPLLLLAAAAPVGRLATSAGGRVLLAAAALWSWLAVWPITLAFPFPPNGVPLPSLTFAPRLLADGALLPSWLPTGIAGPLWAVLALAAAAVLLGAAAGDAREGAFATLAVTVLAAVAAAVAPAPSAWPARLGEAVAHDVYAGAAPGALEALRAGCATPERCARLEWWIARRDALRGARPDSD